MKNLPLLITALFLGGRIGRAELAICAVSYKEQPGFTEPRPGARIWIGKPLATFPNPAEVTIERKYVMSLAWRHGAFVNGLNALFTFGFTQDQLKQIAAQLPQDRTTQLGVLLNGNCLGYTPCTRDWVKYGIAAGTPGQPQVYDDQIKKLQAAGIAVKGSVHYTIEEFENLVKTRDPRAASGTIEGLICNGKVDNPVQAQVSPTQKAVICLEPVQAAISLRNIGVDQSAFPVLVRALGVPAANLKAVSGEVLAADAKRKTPDSGGERLLLSEGDSSTVEVNLTRELKCEYANPGTGPLALQLRLEIAAGGFYNLEARHSSNAWLDLPAPEMKAVAFAEAQFQSLQRVAVTGGNDTVRLGTHPLEGKPVTVAVYSKAGAVQRILRLDPNPDTKAWEMAWDAKTQQLHILGHGTRSRYWMSAADQLGWEVRMDVADQSKLETTDGQVRRVE